jgi:hydrogenase expression/formation protein HypC
MCLAIPARLVEYIDDERMYGKVELGGVQRRINTSLLVGEDATEPGEYVLVHVGFALSRVSEKEAAETLRILEEMGPAYTDEVEQIREWQAMEEELVGAHYREGNGNGGVPA